MNELKFDPIIDTAQQALLAAGVHVQKMFGQSLDNIDISYKVEDGDTPRTLIDKYAEEAALNVIHADKSPLINALVNAEETGVHGSTTGDTIVYLDPFDGTSNALCKLEMSTLGIGIWISEQPYGCAILNPFERKLYAAQVGQGAQVVGLTFDGEEFSYSSEPVLLNPKPADSSKERFAWVDALFNEHTAPRKTGWLNDITELVMNVRMTGSNIHYSTMLAEGRGHIQLTDAVGGFFDLCGIPLIMAVGGKFTDIKGNIPKPDCQVAVASLDPSLHDKVLDVTQKHYGVSSILGEYKGFRG